MDDAKRELVRAWLIKASNDLKTAREIGAPYATGCRYPRESAALEPSRMEFDEALNLATGLVNFVLSVLPGDVRPNGTGASR